MPNVTASSEPETIICSQKIWLLSSWGMPQSPASAVMGSAVCLEELADASLGSPLRPKSAGSLRSNQKKIGMTAKQIQAPTCNPVRQSHSRKSQVISGGTRKPPSELPVAVSPKANPRRRINQRLTSAALGMAPINRTPRGIRLAQTTQT